MKSLSLLAFITFFIGIIICGIASYFINAKTNESNSKLEKENKKLIAENITLKKSNDSSDARITLLNVSIDSIKRERKKTLTEIKYVPMYIDSLKKLPPTEIASNVDSVFKHTSGLHNPDSSYISTLVSQYRNRTVYIVDPNIALDYLGKNRSLGLMMDNVVQCDGENRMLGYKIVELEKQKKNYDAMIQNYDTIVGNKDKLLIIEKKKSKLYKSLFYSTTTSSVLLLFKVDGNVALLTGAGTGLVTYTFNLF